MCLDTRFKPEVEKSKIAKLPNKPITVYRYVKIGPVRYRALYTKYYFKNGINVAKASKTGGQTNLRGLYKPGFHSYKTRAGAKWVNSFRGCTLIKAQIRKEWIIAIGKHNGCIVYVTDKITSPSLRDKSAIVE